MKTLCYIGCLLVLVAVISPGQTLMHYGYEGPFPDTTVNKLPFNIINGGLGVDPVGNVWIQTYDRSTGWSSVADSIDIGGGVYRRLNPIYVLTPAGSQVSFSPIKILNVGADTDTLLGTSNTGGRLGYGGTTNPSNGNFVAVYGTLTYKPGALLYEIDYKTGMGVTRVLGPTGIGTNSPASVAVDADGEFFLAGVLGGIPGQILNFDGSAGVQFSAGVDAIGRAIAVSRDGNDVYVPRFTNSPPSTFHYHSDAGSLGPYTLADTLFVGMSTEAIAVHPVTGYVWVSADYRSKPDTVKGIGWNANTFYAYDPVSKAIVDSFTVSAWTPTASPGPLPRGIAFSPTGDTVYVAHFDASGTPAVARFISGLTGVQREPNAVPAGYELAQNYPNPFNPSTEIRFSLGKPGMTTLRVYDILGREVATLVNENLTAGSFKVKFDASRLTSGTYVYELRSDKIRLVNKMILMK